MFVLFAVFLASRGDFVPSLDVFFQFLNNLYARKRFQKAAEDVVAGHAEQYT
jgi:hypothetical protein